MAGRLPKQNKPILTKTLRQLFAVISAIDRRDPWPFKIISSRKKRRILRTFQDSCAPFLSGTVEMDGLVLEIPRSQYYRYVFQDHEPGTKQTIKRAVHPGMTVIDVGANIGYFSLLLAKLVGPQGKVYAVEPSKGNLDYLQKNVKLNKMSNIQIIPFAAGARSESRKLYIHAAGSQNSFYARGGNIDAEQVEIVSLNRVITEQVHFAKIDVEGHEIEVLKGMNRILQATPEIRLIIEWNSKTLQRAGRLPQALPEFLLQRGFVLSIIDDRTGVLRNIAETNRLQWPELLSKSQHVNLFAERRKN